jgi:UDP-2,3-diacylglucosamine pyrophosphatase LpxH
MGDGTASDNFRLVSAQFDGFLHDKIYTNTNAALVLAGDTFEFWQSKPADVLRAYAALLRRLLALNTVFVIGNHDADVGAFLKTEFQDAFLDRVCASVEIERCGKVIQISHGHEFDHYNSGDAWTGHAAARFAALVEQTVGTRIMGRATEDVLEGGWNSCKASFSSLFQPRNGATLSDLRAGLLSWSNARPFQYLISGHTHQSGLVGNWYGNAGCWKDNGACFGRILSDQQIQAGMVPPFEIRRWPGCQLMENQL